MLFFSSRKIFFSLINSFFFSIWTAKTSLRSVLTTIQISKKKELIAEKKKFLSEKKLRMRALPFQCNAFPATKKIYSTFYQFSESLQYIVEHIKNLEGCFSVSARYGQFWPLTWSKSKILTFSIKQKIFIYYEKSQTSSFLTTSRVKIGHILLKRKTPLYMFSIF